MADFIIKSRRRKDYTQFTARIETDTLDNIKKIVEDNNLISINEFINDCLKFAIDNLLVLTLWLIFVSLSSVFKLMLPILIIPLYDLYFIYLDII